MSIWVAAYKCLQYLGASVVHMVELDLSNASLGNTDKNALLLNGDFFKKHRLEAGSIQQVSIITASSLFLIVSPLIQRELNKVCFFFFGSI
jgi:hypothetical protein